MAASMESAIFGIGKPKSRIFVRGRSGANRARAWARASRFPSLLPEPYFRHDNRGGVNATRPPFLAMDATITSIIPAIARFFLRAGSGFCCSPAPLFGWRDWCVAFGWVPLVAQKSSARTSSLRISSAERAFVIVGVKTKRLPPGIRRR